MKLFYEVEPAVTLFADMKLINGGHGTKETKVAAQGGPLRRGPAPVEVQTTMEPTLFDIDLTVNKVNFCTQTGLLILFYVPNSFGVFLAENTSWNLWQCWKW